MPQALLSPEMNANKLIEKYGIGAIDVADGILEFIQSQMDGSLSWGMDEYYKEVKELIINKVEDSIVTRII
jgi:hypothetical protein